MNTVPKTTSDPYRLTTEMYIHDVDDQKLVVHLPILGYAFKATQRYRSILEKIVSNGPLTEDEKKSKVISMLGKVGAFSPNRKKPSIEDLSEYTPYEGTLIFTETCNLSCSYCYASSSPNKSTPMTLDIAKAAADEVIKNAQLYKHKTAMFRYIGGGEPTIEWPLLEDITKYIDENTRKLLVKRFIRLITNGTLLTESKVKWISDQIDFVTLSFDILPELQANRPFNSGRNTQNKLLEVINLLDKYNVPFHVRSTISNQGAGRMLEMVKYLNKHTNVKQVRLEPMAEIGRSTTGDLSKPKQQQFVDAFIKAHQFGKSVGIDVTCKMFDNIKRRTPRFCNVEFAVAPDGHLAGCHRYSRNDHTGYEFFSIGSYINGKFEFNMDQINRLRKVNAGYFEDCKDCAAKWSCASGCLSARYNSEGVMQNGPLCHLTRELLKYSILEKL